MISPSFLSQEISSLSKVSIDSLVKNLETHSEKGLSTSSVSHRLKIFGKNVLKDETKTHIILQYLANFKNPLMIILMCVSFISFFMGEIIDGFIVLMMVFLSVTLNFLQEYRADQAVRKLKDSVATLARVIREGKEQDIYARNLVIGDIVELNAGDLVPADSRILICKDFFVNQSSLTGESFPVEKITEISDKDDSNLRNIVFFGTSVVTGSAKVVVIKTGSQTEFGKIAKTLSRPSTVNEFSRGINDFSVFILKVVVCFVVFIFFANSLIKGITEKNILESFMFAIAVAVGLTPEFLPMIMSVTMGKGSLNMAKKGVIVKKLTSIPTFGSMDILCTDKTGTLTMDKIELVKYTNITGVHSESVLHYAYLNSFFETGITNPLDQAVVNFRKLDIAGYEKIDEIPFDFMRKKMSVVVEKDGKRIMITKGAPEEIFKVCSSYHYKEKTHKLNAEMLQMAVSQYQELSKTGFRVLAVAIKEVKNGRHVYETNDEVNLELYGFTAFLDPARNDAKSAISDLEKMGIEIKVITGDNELVAEKICRDVSLPIKGVLLGSEIEGWSIEDLTKRVEKTTLFARFSPDQKNMVIQSLQKNGHVVGYMGDGINDAPSLKTSDVGISVNNAVDVAKESADMILTKKSLHQLKDGVIEGRRTFANTLKYIMMGISSNFGNMFSVLGAVLFLPFLPMIPIQILLNNFLYDFSQLSIPTDNVDSEFVQRPKRWDIAHIRNFMIVFGPISSVFDFVSFFVLYKFFSNSASSFQTGWFIESLATQVFIIYIIRTRKIPFLQSSPSIYLLLTTLLAVGIGWAIPYNEVGAIFQFLPLPMHVLFLLAGIVGVYLLVTELVKRFFYNRFYNQA